jgi:hypothetical protein
MSSRGKKKTTMAKLSRESRLRERRLEKEARKRARRYDAAPQLTQDTWLRPETPGPADSPASDPGAVESVSDAQNGGF